MIRAVVGLRRSMWDHPVSGREDPVSADGIRFAACGRASVATGLAKRLAVAT